MKKAYVILVIAKSDAWYDKRERLIGKVIVITNSSHKGGGWYACNGNVVGEVSNYCFYRVKLGRIK